MICSFPEIAVMNSSQVRYIIIFLTLLYQRGTDPGWDPELLCSHVVNVCMGTLVRKRAVAVHVENRKWKMGRHENEMYAYQAPGIVSWASTWRTSTGR
jgi:hypothetical protein